MKMTERLKMTLLLVLILFSAVSVAQTPADANACFESGNYQLALEAYQSLLKKKPKEALYNYRYAYSAYMLHDKATAIDFFKKSADKYPQGYYYLGEMYFDDYAFAEAAAAYSAYLLKPVPDDKLAPKVAKKQKQAELGARFLNRVEDVKIIDSMVVDKNEFLKKIQIPAESGKLAQQQLLTEKGAVDIIRYITQRGDRTCFSELANGQTDLFTAYKLLDEWAEKTSLDDLNTGANENYPFLMLDGVTLYFASDGDDSMGGYDIFITRLNTSDNSYLKPENIGMPFNSPYNDYMMIVDELHKVGWFASDRFLPEGKVAIYQFIPNTEKKIVKSENQQTLAATAQIRHIEKMEGDFKIMPQNVDNQEDTKSEKIFINDTTFYSDASGFRSNIARNNYFQLQKLIKEMDASGKELATLRKDVSENPGDNQLTEISKKIQALEYRIRAIKPEIEKLSMNMRNEEIKSIR